MSLSVVCRQSTLLKMSIIIIVTVTVAATAVVVVVFVSMIVCLTSDLILD